MSHLFTIKAISKTGGLSLLTTLNYAFFPTVLHGPGGGYRVEFLDSNATDDVRQVLIVGDYTGLKEGEHGKDEDFYANVRRCEKVYIENEKGATVQALHTNIAHVPYFPKAFSDENARIRAEQEASLGFRYIIRTVSQPHEFIAHDDGAILHTSNQEDAGWFQLKSAAWKFLEDNNVKKNKYQVIAIPDPEKK